MFVTSSTDINIAITLGALIFLILFAEKLIRSIVNIANYYNISKLFLGLVALSIGTSIPEIFTHIIGSIEILRGAADYDIISGAVLGTNIGSDIIQQCFIIGIVALISVVYLSQNLRKDFIILIGATLLLWIFAVDLNIARQEGFLLVLFYIAYIYFVYRKESKRLREEIGKEIKKEAKPKINIFYEIFLSIISLAGLIICAEVVLQQIENFVITYNLEASLIGIVTLGIATALPELTTAVIGILKGKPAISLGTLIGSNITNPMLALGLGAMISTYSVPVPVFEYDLPFKAISAGIILAIFWKGMPVKKKYGIIMILMYFAYLIGRIILY